MLVELGAGEHEHEPEPVLLVEFTLGVRPEDIGMDELGLPKAAMVLLRDDDYKTLCLDVDDRQNPGGPK